MDIEIQKKMAQVEVKIDKFDTNIDKLTDISLNVSKLLAVHEQRLDSVEKSTKASVQYIEDRRKETDAMFNRVYDKISETEDDIRTELNQVQTSIVTEVKSISVDIGKLRNDVNTTTNQIKDDLEDKLKKEVEEISERMSKIEKFMWIVTGGAAVAGAVISQLADAIKISI